jgi:lactate dehydrogenase-like 2-hydroxyacid dehydrogenase
LFRSISILIFILVFSEKINKDAVADFAVGLLLNTLRRISESINEARVGKWDSWDMMWMTGKGLSGATVGIFGLGRIGNVY